MTTEGRRVLREGMYGQRQFSPDLAAAVARLGVDATAEPRPLRDALRAATADRSAYVG